MIWDYFHVLLSVGGSVASIWGFTQGFGPCLNNQGLAAVVLLGIISIGLITYSTYLTIKYRRKSKYAGAFQDLNIAFSNIHALDREDWGKEEDMVRKIQESLRRTCNGITNTFSKLNGHHVSTSIKLLVLKDSEICVQTFARDETSEAKGHETRPWNQSHEKISQNSEFKFIYSNFENQNINTTAYSANNLPVRDDYENAWLNQLAWPPRKVIPLLDKVYRRKQWPLDYRSTIVVPIIPLMSNEKSLDLIRGFLCIQSPKERPFYNKTDEAILRGVADGIYTKIDRIIKMTNNGKKEEHGKHRYLQAL